MVCSIHPSVVDKEWKSYDLCIQVMRLNLCIVIYEMYSSLNV